MHDRGMTYSGSCRRMTLAHGGRIMSSVQGMSVARVGHGPEATRIARCRQGDGDGGLGVEINGDAKAAGCGRGVLHPLFE